MAKNLSDLGVGNKDTMEDIIEQEAEQMAETFKKNNGAPFKSKVRRDQNQTH